ncbi:phosphatase PAP2 family protein [Micromonospora sp. NPDC093277]|uniref:phosphatase PAP2 family protein n=1 Tax=Micromonospora sp. NPDC093277 TaxID=3364291 RepID=UPI0037F8AA82
MSPRQQTAGSMVVRSWLAARLTPGGALGLPLTVSFLMIAAAGWGLGELADSVRENDDLAAGDAGATAWMVAHRTGWLTAALRVVTDLGGVWMALALVAVAALGIPLSGSRWRTAALMALVTGGTSALVNGVKLLIARPRPTLPEMISTASGFSFPSGHSAQAVAAYASLAYLIGRRWPVPAVRVSAWAGAGLVVLLVGFSRLYLGVHWLTDVLGGYLLAAAWTTAVWAAVRLATSSGGAASRRQDQGTAEP